MATNFFGQPTMAVGQFHQHDTDGLIEVTGGYYLDPIYHRVSNHFYWTVVATGEKKSGYGGDWPLVTDNGVIGLARYQGAVQAAAS